MTFISITKSNKNYINNYNTYLKTQIHPLYKSNNKYSFSFKLFNTIIHITNSNYIFNIDDETNNAIKYNTTIKISIYTLNNFKISKSFYKIFKPNNSKISLQSYKNIL